MSRLLQCCSIADCNNSVWARGWCRKHYYRWHKHGDPLVTVARYTEAGAPEKFLASLPVTGDGCVTWPYTTNNVGYAQINNPTLGKRLVTRIVCERTNGPAPSDRHVAAHECGKGHEGCIAPWHLSWKTPAENAADMVRHGTLSYGERHASKLTEADVLAIRRIGSSRPQAAIAAEFGVSQRLISRILRNEVWRRAGTGRAALAESAREAA